MSKFDVFKKRDKKLEERKAIKKEVDASVDLSDRKSIKLMSEPSTSSKYGYHRLLDEGAVVRGGEVECYIPKGELKIWINNLSEDSRFFYNNAHIDPLIDATAIIGEWGKKDLRLVDIGDGRSAVDVKLNLDDEHAAVKTLKNNSDKYGFDLGLSAELSGSINWAATEIYEYKLGVVLNDITITGISVVGSVGNVNSQGLKFGDNKEGKMSFMEKLRATMGFGDEPKDEPKVEEKFATEEEFRAELSTFIEGVKAKDAELEKVKTKLAAAEAENIELKKLLEKAGEDSKKVDEVKEELDESKKVNEAIRKAFAEGAISAILEQKKGNPVARAEVKFANSDIAGGL
ncbi:MAG: hypothetical protein FWE25_03315 [Lachnospiraceae bacterium]|nr:hypothetical protein [Lachnospiraceae bacterium]